MSQWQGSGLPRSAVERIKAATSSDLRFSQLSVGGQLAVESCALRPIGTVIGCTAQRLDWGEFGLGEVGCGYVPPRALRSSNIQTTSYYPPSGAGVRDGLNKSVPIVVPGTALPFAVGDAAASASHLVYADAAQAAWRLAIARMSEEARALGADGIVGAKLSERRGKRDIREFEVTGTAVISTGAVHLARPFATTLSGEDVAKLLRAGWLPASIVLGLSVAIGHDTYRARRARSRLTSAREIVAISALVQAARHHARQQLRSKTQEMGADGAVLTSQVTLSIEQHRLTWMHHDIVVRAAAIATAIVEVDRGGTPPPSGNRSVISLTR